ncbi:DUF5695 domain-containing protein [Novosphingobium sp.]|uniref:DUF5695 domain-containing protein n=1 Tax=Novosphingobium sp. TaxID=1874826 RepID=UPI002FE207C0
MAGAFLPALQAPVLAASSPPLVPRKVGSILAAPGKPFRLGFDGGRVTSLSAASKAVQGDFIHAGAALGDATGTYRIADHPWQRFETRTQAPEHVRQAANGLETRYLLAPGLFVTCSFALEADGLHLTLTLSNETALPIEFGDLALPLPINMIHAVKDDPNAVLKHSFISGRNSHIFWQRKDSLTPWLAMLPANGAALEYWDAPKGSPDLYRVFFHAAAEVAAVQAAGSRWRLPATSLALAPGKTAQRGVRFLLVDGYAAMRRTIAEHGLIDVEVVPGMTVPTDLDVTLSLGSSVSVVRLEPEHPAHTEWTPLGERAGRKLFRLRFARLGENHVTLHQADGGRSTLEFFVTEPVETMIAKRGAFIAAHRHRDPAKWYDGLLAEWNMESETLLGPDNYDRIKGWRIYEVTCDDPGLSKPAFLAAKNAEYPVQAEIDALDDYVEHFVWGGLQRTTEEQWPYALYGIPDWKRNRDSADPGDKGRKHFWRPYDYPHIALMYFALYRIARDRHGFHTRLAAADYLDRAFGTARAMFVIPKEIIGWEADSTGFYNELVIPDVIEALRREGRMAQADELAGHWEHKVAHFVNEVDDLFASEYAFDSTGFETTQAIARYALDRPERIPPEHARAFAKRQMDANLFCRGWLQPSYYTLGSDYRAQAGDAYTLSYMAQMGGWAILDHALNDTPDFRPLLRLGHASALSSWALLNSGTPESGYGYWYPGKANDGGAGGGFEPAALGETWLEQPHRHGSWYYSCEIDLGFCGALRAAATTLVDDELFGRIALSGMLEEHDDQLLIHPRDGVRRRFHARLGARALDIHLLDDGRFASDTPIRVSHKLDECAFEIDHSAGPARTLRIHISDRNGLRWKLAESDRPPVADVYAIVVKEGTQRTSLKARAG